MGEDSRAIIELTDRPWAELDEDERATFDAWLDSTEQAAPADVEQLRAELEQITAERDQLRRRIELRQRSDER